MHVETLVDQQRDTPASAVSPGHHGRTLITTVFYPARGRPGGQPAPDVAPDRQHRPYPLVVFAHGFGAGVDDYAELLRRWAEAGYVVAMPLFPLTNRATPGSASLVDYPNQPADMSFVITELLQAAAGHGGLLAGLVDSQRVGAGGHSLGGVTTFGLVANTCCLDPRVRAAVVMAGDQISFPQGTVATGKAPPLLLVHGDADSAVPYQASVDAYKAANPPKGLLTLSGGDHNAPEDPAGRAFPSVVRATIDFFDRYLKGHRGSLALLRADGRAGVSQLVFADQPGEPVTLPTASTSVVRHRSATVTPSSKLADRQPVTVAWQGYAPGFTVNVLQCSRNPPTGPGDCDLHSAQLLHPDPPGAGSLTFVAHTGPVGSRACDAVHTGCVIVVNEGGSLDPTASVVVPISFAPDGTAAAPTTTAPAGPSVAQTFCLSAPLVGRIRYTSARGTGTPSAGAGEVVGDVGGFPPDAYVLGQWVDATVTPAKTVSEVSFRTDTTGAQYLSLPSFIDATARVTAIVFRVGTNDADARPYGPPAYPCAR